MIEVIILRVIVGTLILRFPLIGAILSMIADYQDMSLLILHNSPDLNKYQQIDKVLDLYYLSIEAFIVLGWKNQFIKHTTIGLYLYRSLGTLLFVITQNKMFLVLFPNLFELFFLIYLLVLTFFKEEKLIVSKKHVIALLLVLLIPKIFHEYLLHINTTHPWSENKYIREFR